MSTPRAACRSERWTGLHRRDQLHVEAVHCGSDRLQTRLECRVGGRIVGLHEALQRDQKPDDLLLAGLEAAADPVMRDAAQVRAIDQTRRRPGIGCHVHVELLQQGRGHEIAPAGQDTGRLRAPQRLAAGERDEVDAHVDEAPQVLLGRQLCRRVDDQGNAVGPTRRDGRRQVDDAAGIDRKGHRHDRRRQGGLDLPGLQPAHAGAGAPVVVADIDQPRPRGCQRMGVAGALGSRDQDVMREGAGMRECRHLRDVPAGDRRRRREREGCRRTGRDEPRLRAGCRGDTAAGGVLQFADIDRRARRGGHRGYDLGRHHRAAQPRQRARCIDPPSHAEKVVRVCLGHAQSLAQLLRPAQ